MIFVREGCTIRHAAAQNRPLRPGRRTHFPPSFWSPLSRPAFSPFFSAGPPSRSARALLFVPADRVDFSFRASARPRPRTTMAACPKIRRWGGALSRGPRVFFAAHPSRRLDPPAFSRTLAHPHSSSRFFSPPFFRYQPPLRLHLPPTSTSTSIRLSRRLRCSHARRAPPRLRPRGVF